MTVPEIFANWAMDFSPEEAAASHFEALWLVGPYILHMKVDGSSCHMRSERPLPMPLYLTQIVVDVDTFLEISQGRVTMQKAHHVMKLKVDGTLSVLLDIQAIFGWGK